MRLLLAGALFTLLGVLALAYLDTCGPYPPSAPTLLSRGRAEGPLEVGAAKQQLHAPPKSIRAGYAPPRPDAEPGGDALFARALVLQVGEERVALATVDSLLVPAALTQKVRARLGAETLDAVHVFATHTHSSFGGYDARAMAELAGTGRFDQDAEETLVLALTQAIREAVRTLAPATLELLHSRGDIGIGLRSEGEGPDDRLQLLRFATASARHTLVLFAAHPTLHPREAATLDPDFPGRVTELLDASGGVSLFLQGAVGNTRVSLQEGSQEEKMETFAKALVRVGLAGTASVHERIVLAHSRTKVPLPRPDSTRLAPGVVRGAADTLLCASAAPSVEVSALSVGPLTMLLVPGEATEAAGRVLEQRTGADRVLSLADDYLGYIERADRVRRNTGEARRQYFGPELIDVLGQGGKLAVEATQTSILGSSGSGR